jgi:hypothetical protein
MEGCCATDIHARKFTSSYKLDVEDRLSNLSALYQLGPRTRVTLAPLNGLYICNFSNEDALELVSSHYKITKYTLWN